MAETLVVTVVNLAHQPGRSLRAAEILSRVAPEVAVVDRSDAGQGARTVAQGSPRLVLLHPQWPLELVAGSLGGEDRFLFVTDAPLRRGFDELWWRLAHGAGPLWRRLWSPPLSEQTIMAVPVLELPRPWPRVGPPPTLFDPLFAQLVSSAGWLRR